MTTERQDKEEKKTRNVLFGIAICSALTAVGIFVYMTHIDKPIGMLDAGTCPDSFHMDKNQLCQPDKNTTQFKFVIEKPPKENYFIEQNQSIPKADAAMITKIIVFYHAEDIHGISQNVTRIYEHYHSTPINQIIEEYKHDGQQNSTDYYQAFYYDVKSTILAQMLPVGQCEITNKCDAAMP